jgi:Ni,Fe-hydrogenase III large subunit
MASLTEIAAQGRRIEAHRPWPRVVVTADAWRAVAGELAAGRATLLGLWAEAGASGAVHMAVIGQDTSDIAVVSLECPERKFPSVGARHPPAIRLERAIQSLYGLEPIGAADTRPWLDLGFWDVQFPLGAKLPAPATRPGYDFLPVEGENLHRIPVGPVHAGIIEPGHFRFTCSGETVARLEQRLGYAHKGIAGLMAGASLERGARLAARISGDSTVAYSIAFAHAVEAALKIEVPPRARYLRALMAELERLANHFGDIGAICNDASFAIMHTHCGLLREQVLRAADACCGHRLMMDRVIPGGVAADVGRDATAILREALKIFRQRFPRLVELYDNTASLQDRTVSTGIVRADHARKFGASGYVGRASGRNFDVRKALCYAPYDELEFAVPVLSDGDVNARIWIRIREVEQSLSLVDQIIARMPDGPIARAIEPAGNGEGLGLAEGFRGDVLAAVRIEQGRVAHCHLRDPSWFQWPLLEAAIEGNIVADFPLCNKSFNCSYSGHDI